MSEATFWRSLKNGLTKHSNREIFLQRLENKTQSGIPDVFYYYHYTSGFIELKYIKQYPKDANSKLGIKLTAIQIAWMRNYVAYCGSGWYLIKIHRDVYLVDGIYAQRIPNLTREELWNLNTKAWINKGVDYPLLLSYLQNDSY